MTMKYNKIPTSVLPYKFRIEVSGSRLWSICHRDRGRTSPLRINIFNELAIRALFCLSKAGRIALISDGTAISLLIE